MKFIMSIIGKAVACLYISVIIISCTEKSTQSNDQKKVYSQMLFERQGGGNIIFTALFLSSHDSLHVNVSRKEFRDTNIQIILIRNSHCSGLFDTLFAMLHGDITIDGDFRQSALPSGTWANLYLTNGNEIKEIRNIQLRSTLLNLEILVHARLSASEIPAWISEMIETFKSQPVGNPPQSIWQYEYHGQIVYYVPPQCCDQFSVLYDASGNAICAPDGGFSGTGDGHCPDFCQERTNEVLIWRDSRSR